VSSEQRTILIVDDEPSVCWALAQTVRTMGHAPLECHSAEAAFEALGQQSVDLAIVDIQLPGMDGLTALERLKDADPDLPVIVVTAHGTMETAIRAHQAGAFEYFLKPVDLAEVRMAITSALAGRRAGTTAAAPQPSVPPPTMIGACAAMQEVFKRIAAVAQTEMTVLIEGATGTGKELVARAIHDFSPRAEGPFVALNCAAMQGPLLESELFGHVRGAFTGADRDKRGKIELADGGTLLLDEVGELPGEAQAKLLRFLEDRQFFRVGSTRQQTVDVRVLAATNRPLRLLTMTEPPPFRKDLYFRLCTVTIRLPPLSKRGEDIDLLIDHYTGRYGAQGVSRGAREVLRRYHWPGNVRELMHAVEYAAVMARGKAIEAEHLPREVLEPAGGVATETAAGLQRAADEMLEEILASAQGNGWTELISRWERPLLAAAMRRFGGNQLRIATALKIHRSTLRKKLRSYGLLGT